MGAALALLLVVLLKPGDSTLEALPFAQIAPGTASAADVLAGRVNFEPIGKSKVPPLSWIRLSIHDSAPQSSRWVLLIPFSVDVATVCTSVVK